MEFSGTKDSKCFVCGPDNPFGLLVPFERDGDVGSRARYIARQEHAGWSGILHGGVTLSLMDEAFGWCLFFQGVPSVTARIEVRFHKPIPIETTLHVRAWIVRQRRRLYDAQAEVRIGDGDTKGVLVAESDATLYRIAPGSACRKSIAPAEVAR